MHYSSYNNFKEPVTDQIRLITRKDNKIGAISIDVEENKINAMYSYKSKICGAPIRDFLHKKLELQKGEYGQIIFNGRFSDRNEEGNWIYEKKVLNMIITDSVDMNIFKTTSIEKQFLDMSNLR